MKKIIAFTVLLALLSFAVFAQDGSGWKIGFKAQYFQDLVFTAKASGKGKVEQTNTDTETSELGKYIKGRADFFGNTAQEDTHDRINLSLKNDGDHHHFYIDIQWDDTWGSSGVTLWNFLQKGPGDWYFAGDTGASGNPLVFDGKVGTGRYDGWINRFDVWSDWIGDGGENFFGVRKYSNGSAKGDFKPSDTIGAVDGSPWGTVFAVGATYDGKFRLALGSGLQNPGGNEDGAYTSQSNTKFSAIISGRPVDLLTFDVFYSLNGKDTNTTARSTGQWTNIIGAYAGVDLGKIGINGLGVNAGYTANFDAYEKQGGLVNTDTSNPAQQAEKSWDKTAPVYSGIDVNVSYNGIDKLGVTLRNNISFASAEANYREHPTYDNIIVGLDGTTFSHGKDGSATQNWFAYRARLQVSYGLTDNLSVGLDLQDVLGVYTTASKSVAGSVTTTQDVTTTTNVLETSLYAKYGVGNVSFGLGLTLGINSISKEDTTKTSGGGSDTTTKKTGNLDVVRFHVPLVFKVSI